MQGKNTQELQVASSVFNAVDRSLYCHPKGNIEKAHLTTLNFASRYQYRKAKFALHLNLFNVVAYEIIYCLLLKKSKPLSF